MKICELRVNRNLLNPSFEGYKLQTKHIPLVVQSVDAPALKLKPNDKQYSLLHTHMFCMQNHLFTDPWAHSMCYFVNSDFAVVCAEYDETAETLKALRTVCQMPKSSVVTGDYNCSLRFISEQHCIFCDGANKLYLYETGDRQASDDWKQLSETWLGGETNTRGFMLYEARSFEKADAMKVTLVYGHITDENTTGQTPHFYIQMHCASWEYYEVWFYKEELTFKLCAPINYCAFETGNEYLMICANHGIRTPELDEAEKRAKNHAENLLDGFSEEKLAENKADMTEVTKRACFEGKTKMICAGSDAEYTIERFHLPTNKVTHGIILGATPPLFTKYVHPGQAPAFVLNADFNAAIWTHVNTTNQNVDWIFNNEGILHAFGYVQASKEQKKFIDCAPNLSFAVVCEAHRYVFIYKTQFNTDENLRNRRHPDSQVHYGDSHVVPLHEDFGEIIGISASNHAIILLSENAIICLKVF